MPELAEVETLRIYLEKKLVGEEIVHFHQNRGNLRYKLDENLGNMLENSKIISLKRRAKYLIIELDNNNSAIVHLGMSGRFVLYEGKYHPKKHDHIILSLKNNNFLVFNDARRFGMFYAFPSENLNFAKIFSTLGPEPLTDDFNENYLYEKLKNLKKPIKNALMDNQIVVGVGNIYAAESLYEAKISPQRPSFSITKSQSAQIIKAVKFILNKAINMGGTTLRDFVGGDNKAGYFKQELLVYGQEGKKCSNCTNLIVKIKLSGRSSFYCNKCQT